MPDISPLQQLFNEYNSKYNLANDYNEFASVMSDEGNRKLFFNEYNSKLNLAKSFAEFDGVLGLKKKEPSAASSTGSAGEFVSPSQQQNPHGSLNALGINTLPQPVGVPQTNSITDFNNQLKESNDRARKFQDRVVASYRPTQNDFAKDGNPVSNFKDGDIIDYTGITANNIAQDIYYRLASMKQEGLSGTTEYNDLERQLSDLSNKNKNNPAFSVTGYKQAKGNSWVDVDKPESDFLAKSLPTVTVAAFKSKLKKEDVKSFIDNQKDPNVKEMLSRFSVDGEATPDYKRDANGAFIRDDKGDLVVDPKSNTIGISETEKFLFRRKELIPALTSLYMQNKGEGDTEEGRLRLITKAISSTYGLDTDPLNEIVYPGVNRNEYAANLKKLSETNFNKEEASLSSRASDLKSQIDALKVSAERTTDPEIKNKYVALTKEYNSVIEKYNKYKAEAQPLLTYFDRPENKAVNQRFNKIEEGRGLLYMADQLFPDRDRRIVQEAINRSKTIIDPTGVGFNTPGVGPFMNTVLKGLVGVGASAAQATKTAVLSPINTALGTKLSVGNTMSYLDKASKAVDSWTGANNTTDNTAIEIVNKIGGLTPYAIPYLGEVLFTAGSAGESVLEAKKAGVTNDVDLFTSAAVTALINKYAGKLLPSGSSYMEGFTLPREVIARFLDPKTTKAAAEDISKSAVSWLNKSYLKDVGVGALHGVGSMKIMEAGEAIKNSLLNKEYGTDLNEGYDFTLGGVMKEMATMAVFTGAIKSKGLLDARKEYNPESVAAYALSLAAKDYSFATKFLDNLKNIDGANLNTIKLIEDQVAKFNGVLSFPSNFTTDQKVAAFNILSRKRTLQDQKAKSESDFHPAIDEQIKELDNKLAEIQKNPESASTEVKMLMEPLIDNTILKSQEDAITQSAVRQQERLSEGRVAEPSRAQEGQPEVGKPEGEQGKTTQPITDVSHSTVGSSGEIKVGDDIQWSVNGEDKFSSPRKITSISDDGNTVFVEGMKDGIPAKEVGISVDKEIGGDSVTSLLGSDVEYRGKKGTLIKDGQSVIFKSSKDGVEYEIGNIDEMSRKNAEEFGFKYDKPSVEINESGNFVVSGVEYRNNAANPLDAIRRSSDGKTHMVVLSDVSGKPVKFKGNVANDIAYQITLKEINKNNEAREGFEQHIADNAGNEIVAAEAGRTAEGEKAGVGSGLPKEATRSEKIDQVAKGLTTTEREHVRMLANLGDTKGVKAFFDNKIAEMERVDKVVEDVIRTTSEALEATGIQYKLIDSSKGDTSAEGNKGLFIGEDGVIIIDRAKLKNAMSAGETIWHESAHPIINIIRNSDKPLYDSLVKGLEKAAKSDNSIRKVLNWAEKGYGKDGKDSVNDESIVQTIAKINTGEININSLPTGFKQKIIDFVNSVAKMLGIDPILSDTDIKKFKDTLSKVADALKTGKDISDIVGKENVKDYIIDGEIPNKTKQAMFSQEFFENGSEFEKLLNTGYVIQNSDISKFNGQPIAIHNPDSFATGKIKFMGEDLVDGEGGIYFTLKYKDVWASSKKSSASQLAGLINSSLGTDGKYRMALVKGDPNKNLTSVKGAKAVMGVLEILSDKGLIPLYVFRKALNSAGKNYGIDFDGRNDAKSIHNDIKDKFINVDNSSFSRRGDFVRDVIDEISKQNVLSKEDISKISNAIEASRKMTTFSKASVLDAVSNATTEGILRDVPNSHVYAVIETDSPVTIKYDGRHESYPWHITTEDGSRPKLYILKDKPYFNDAFVAAKQGKNVNKGERFGDISNAGLAQRGMGLAEVKVSKAEAPAGSRLFNEPNPEASAIESQYKKQRGIDTPEARKITFLDESRSKKMADAYEKIADSPNDPETQRGYKEMADQTVSQFKAISDAGVKVELWDGEGEPYKNSEEMIKDVRDNKHMFIFSTEQGFGETPITDEQRRQNALLQDSGFKDVNGKTLLVNDLFRFVHDYFGHTKLGNSFGPVGEENAWNVHVRMYDTPLARRAMTMETRGQNSWVNFNKDMRNADGSIKKKGDAGYVSPKDRPFAEQKMGLFPEEFSSVDKSYSDINTEGVPSNVKDDIDNIKSMDMSEESGTTFNIDGTKYTGKGLVVPIASVNTTQSKITPEAIKKFIDTNKDKIHGDNFKVGVYKFADKDQVSIDLNIIVDSKNKKAALEFAKKAGQESIFDLDKMENIKTGSSGKNPMSFTPEQYSTINKDLLEGKTPDVFGNKKQRQVDLEESSDFEDMMESIKKYASEGEFQKSTGGPARIQPAVTSTTGSPKKINEILFDAGKNLGKGIVYGKSGQGAAGTYSPRTGGVVVRFNGDIDVSAHELGHALDDRHNLIEAVEGNSAALAELSQFSPFGSTPPKGHSNPQRYINNEGVAEFIRAYLVNPEEAKKAAPNLYDVLKNTVGSDVMSKLDGFSNDIITWANSSARDKMLSNIQLDKKKSSTILERLFSKKGGEEFGVSWIDKFGSAWLDSLRVFNKAVDHLKGLKEIDEVLPADDPRLLARLINGFDAKFADIAENGLTDSKLNRIVTSDGDTMNVSWLLKPLADYDIDGKIVSVDSATVKKRMEDTVLFMIAERTLEYAKKFGREGLLSGIGGGMFKDVEVAKEFLRDIIDSPDYDKIQEAASRYRQYADGILKYMVDKGRIAKAEFDKEGNLIGGYDYIKKNNEYYVAMNRIMEAEPGEPINTKFEGGGSLASAKNVLKKAKGGTEMISNPYINLLDNAYKSIKEADRNDVMLSFRNLLVNMRGMNEGDVVNTSDIGVRVDKAGPNTATIYVNGTPEYWKLDKDVHAAITSIGHLARLPRFITFLPSLLRTATTSFPVFAARNIVRDTQHRLIVSNHGNLIEKIMALSNSKEEHDMAARSGALNGGLYLKDQESYYSLLNDAKNKITKDGFKVMSRESFSNMFHKYEDFLYKSEGANRIAEYKLAMKEAKKNGMDDYNAMLYAASKSRDLIDFAVAGNYMKVINQIIPFSNAAVQGIRSGVNRAKENPGGFVARTLLYSVLPSLMMWSLNHRDDETAKEYEELPDYQRDMFYNVKLGGEWVVIPKPFELSIFAAGFDRAASYHYGNKKAFDGYAGSIAKSMFPFDASDAGGPLAPELEMQSNYDVFRGKNIIPPHEAGIDIALRDGTDQSSRIGKLIGEAVDADPRMIDYWIKKRLSYWGDFGMKLSNIGADKGPKFDISSTGFSKEFPAYSSKSVTEFLNFSKQYDMLTSKPYKSFSAISRAYFNEKDPEVKKKIGMDMIEVAKVIKNAWEEGGLPEAKKKAKEAKKEYEQNKNN